LKDLHIPVETFLSKEANQHRKIVSLKDISLLIDRQAVEIINLSNLLNSNKHMLRITELKCVNMDSQLKKVKGELKNYHSMYFDLYNDYVRSTQRKTVSPVDSLLSVSREKEIEEMNDLCDDYESQVENFKKVTDKLRDELCLWRKDHSRLNDENKNLKRKLSSCESDLNLAKRKR
jgi:histone H3/H4